MTDTTDRSTADRVRDVATVLPIVLAMVALLAAGAPASATGSELTGGAASLDGGDVVYQTNNTTLPCYYCNETVSVNESEWFEGNENASAPAIVDMLGRIGPYVIGTGDTIPGGSTYAGTIVLGLVVAAVFLGAVMGTGMGAPGGSVAALTVGYGLARAGLAPPWIRVVMLFLLGLAAAVVVKRLTR